MDKWMDAGWVGVWIPLLLLRQSSAHTHSHSILHMHLVLFVKGFPFRSRNSRNSLKKISTVIALWSMTRLGWGVATLLVFVYKIELLQDSHTPFWSFLVLFLLLFVCEIVPIIATLDYSYMNMIGLDRQHLVGDTIEWFPDQDLIDPTAPLLLTDQSNDTLLPQLEISNDNDSGDGNDGDDDEVGADGSSSSRNVA